MEFPFLFYIKVGILQNELYKTKKQLSRDSLNTTDELYITQNELLSNLSTKSELSATRSEVDTNTEVITNIRNELSIIKSQLSFTQSQLRLMNTKFDNKLSITEFKISNIQNELLELRNELILMNKTVQTIKQTARLCGNSDLTFVVAKAEISGNTWRCYPDGTNAMVEPDGVSYCYINGGNYVYFDFRSVFILKAIRFRLWDRDARTYTYSLDISTNRADWTNLATRLERQSLQEYIFDEPTRVRYIQMDGTGTVSNHLALYSMSVDCVDTTT